MDDSVLWAVALGTGMFGLMLLAIAGAIVVYWKTIARKPAGAAPAEKTRSQPGKITTADKERSPANSAAEQPVTVGSPLLWVKAWLFAFLHASTVSLVLGAITFFEDLAKASDEIQRAGTVTFPKQLLPGTLSGSAVSRKRLSQPTGESSGMGDDAGLEGVDQPDVAPASTDGWEVVDNLVGEVGANN